MKLRLIHQYFLTFALVVVIATVSIAHWINNRAATTILGATVETSAVYLQSGIQPYVQSLADGSELSLDDRAALERIVSQHASHGVFSMIKVWSPSGHLLFGPPDESGAQPPLSDIRDALSGRAIGAAMDFEDGDDIGAINAGKRLYEIYFLLFNQKSGDVLAIGEVYEDTASVGNALIAAAFDNWLVIATGGVALFLVFGAIVLRGSRTIDRHVETLRENVPVQAAMQRQNSELRDRVTKATVNVARIDEIAQRRIGADLHDGAAQLLGFILMRMDQLEATVMAHTEGDSERLAEIVSDIRDAASEATREIRRIAQGMLAPHLENVETLEGQIRAVAREHERITGTSVAIQIDDNVPAISGYVAGVLGRITQEALSNAWKHAGGRGQQIIIMRQGDHLDLRIINESVETKITIPNTNNPSGLGVIGMKFRAELVGGTLEVKNDLAETIVECRVPLEENA